MTKEHINKLRNLKYCMVGKGKGKVTQLCLTVCDPMDYIVHGILQVKILEWVAFPFSRGSSQPRDQTQVLPHCRQILYHLNHRGSPKTLPAEPTDRRST